MGWRNLEKILDGSKHGPGNCVDAAKYDEMLDSIEREQEAEVNKLRACLMVLDATIYCLLPGVNQAWAETFKGQIQAAKDAYESATGEESMIGFKRERK
jgi:hypothetical protein